MSFETIKENEGKKVHERSCMMMYYFTPQEARQIMNVARMTGIKDHIVLKPGHGEATIRELLDGKQEETQGEVIKEKAILFNGIEATRMSLFIDSLKKCRIKRPMIAVVTEQSIDWSLNTLLVNLANERSALKQGSFSAHEE